MGVGTDMLCDCNEVCTEETCPCMNLPCELDHVDDKKICKIPRGCLSECSCVRRPNEITGECDT